MKEYFYISENLKFLTQKLEELVNIKVHTEVLNQINSDSLNNLVERKEYHLTIDPCKIKITGIVEEYEPESIVLNFDNYEIKEGVKIKHIIDGYNFSFGSGAIYRPLNETLEIFNMSLK